jgi:rubrerythrin
MGELPPAECQIEVWVLREADFDKANEILRNPRGRNDPPWKCSTCNETCEGQFTQCWSCGAYRAA